ncbi:hypothetical protein PLESTF_001401800 [Pleodorina starrii]|nr:hypothetical protein PLESTF_001401800 [Pleodorina starrii]
MPDGDDVDPATAPPPAAPAARKSVLNRRFPTAPGAGRGGRAPVVAEEDGQSCPGGVCPNPDLYDDGDAAIIGEEPYDLVYDPTYPYDNCHYMGGFHDFRLNGTETCHLRVRGADGHADRLAGGLDGVFLLVGCFEGKPLYIRSRASGPPGEERVLYFNPYFGSWEFSVGLEPSADQLVLAGDEGHTSPLDVPRWHLAAAFSSHMAPLLPAEDEELYYVATGVSVMCEEETEDQALVVPSAAAAAAAARSGEGGKGAGAGAARGREGGPRGEGGRAGKAGGGGGGGQRAAGRGTEGGRGGRLGEGARRTGGEEGEGEGEGEEMVGPEGQEGDGQEEEEEVVGRRWMPGAEDGEADGEPRPPSSPRQSPGAGADGGGREALEQEARELRAYWQRHEEEFYESQYPYGEYPPEGLYEEGYGGPGYDDEYGYPMY